MSSSESCSCESSCGGHIAGSGFALLVVLFILLIIIGATWLF